MAVGMKFAQPAGGSDPERFGRLENGAHVRKAIGNRITAFHNPAARSGRTPHCAETARPGTGPDAAGAVFIDRLHKVVGQALRGRKALPPAFWQKVVQSVARRDPPTAAPTRTEI